MSRYNNFWYEHSYSLPIHNLKGETILPSTKGWLREVLLQYLEKYNWKRSKKSTSLYNKDIFSLILYKNSCKLYLYNKPEVSRVITYEEIFKNSKLFSSEEEIMEILFDQEL